MDRTPLSSGLPGTWQLLSRTDVTAAGAAHPDPALGSDPVALLIYDRAGHFSAQFMKRDRTAAPYPPERRPGGAPTRYPASPYPLSRACTRRDRISDAISAANATATEMMHSRNAAASVPGMPGMLTSTVQ